MAVPMSLIQAIAEFKTVSKVNAASTLKIERDLKGDPVAFKFENGKVYMNLDNAPINPSTETAAFISWMKIRPYIDIINKSGVFFNESDPEQAARILQLEDEKKSMETRIGNLIVENNTTKRGAEHTTIRLNSVTREIEEVKAEQALSKEKSTVKIGDLETQIGAYTQENNQLRRAIQGLRSEKEGLKTELIRNTGHVETQRVLIRETEAANAQLTGRVANLEQRCTLLTNTNINLRTRIQRYEGGVRPKPPNVFNWLLSGVTPPFLMSMCGAVAPAGAYISDATGFTRLLKRKRSTE
jgi:hypothetical protein